MSRSHGGLSADKEVVAGRGPAEPGLLRWSGRRSATATRDEVNRLDTEARQTRERLDEIGAALDAATLELRDALQATFDG